jgi:hypothetical protein
VMYVRESIQILNPAELGTTAIPINSLLRNSSHTVPVIQTMHLELLAFFQKLF